MGRYEAVKLVTGNKNFKNTQESKSYETNVTDLWDEIIHRDRVFMNKDVAEKAVKSTNEFREKLSKEIWGTSPAANG